MNTETGEIEYFKNNDELLKRMAELQGKMIEINPDDMTEKQKKEMKVSLHDHKTTLGKKLQKHKTRTSRRKSRRK